jgi:hypothetical protein
VQSWKGRAGWQSEGGERWLQLPLDWAAASQQAKAPAAGPPHHVQDMPRAVKDAMNTAVFEDALNTAGRV